VGVFRYVRYASNSDQILRRSEMTLWANNGLMHRSKQHLYSITSSARASMDEALLRRSTRILWAVELAHPPD
jgi:hypothetical protein